MTARKALERVRAPDEHGAQQRAWAVVRSAYGERSPASSRRVRWRFALLPALVAVAGAVALSPAGATIARWVKDTLGVPHAAKALFSLPAPGRVLISGGGGTWIVAADGSARRLGSWSEASWSPHGLYIAAVRGDQLAAINPRGTIVWALARPSVSDPRWYAPSGFRVAYLSGQTLRVVAGDGTGDHVVGASSVIHVAPAWRPGHPYQLAYANRYEIVVVRDADTGKVSWTAPPAGPVQGSPSGPVRELAWSDDGQRLLVVTDFRATLYNAAGHVVASVVPGNPRERILDAALSPGGRQLALLLGGGVDRVALADITSRSPKLKPVFSGVGLRQLAWSPNGRWLLVTWPAADQWVFVRVAGAPRIAAVSRIAQQFGAHTSSGVEFPRLDGWCCPRWPAVR